MEYVEKSYFFDSYALVEIFKGNENYNIYQDATTITTYFNLYEAYYSLKNQGVKEKLEDFFQIIKKCCISLKFDWIKEATDFRINHKKENMSYVDCLGYIIAKDLNVKFLTGDNQFKDLKNVEFVK